MNFIERWFHVSLDGGSGTAEVIYFVAVAVLVAVINCRRQLAAFAGRCFTYIKKNR
jgi:hypothetical protein